jgi:eukaryotic-like serine/threonine-protein kinase
MQAGDRVAHYTVVSHIGSGGMGEVYRATDTKLHRDVALKILPETVAGDADRLARFGREAHVLASLNHPNIAAIFGVEESERSRVLVMELVEGPTIEDMLAGGALPIAEALKIANQIALGLQAAHEEGIVHRDLKPANVKVRPDGTVKILDFGLAKIWMPESSSRAKNLSTSPTITSPAATLHGMILGTAAYMAPEQARGRVVDKRADVWAFGCVLYEMLTGTRTFAGTDVTDVLAAIVRGDPDWTALPSATPASVRRLMRRCLIKDGRDRLSDIGVARLEIAEAAQAPESAGATSVPAKRTIAARFGWIAAALVAATLTGLAMWLARPSLSTLPERRAFIAIPDALTWVSPSGSGVAISPDGAWIAYLAAAKSQTLYVQTLGEDVPRQVSGSESAYAPCFSPDSTQIAFFARGKLWRASLAGGPPFELSGSDRLDRGLAWAEDGFIYAGGANGIWRVPQSGGTQESLTKVDKSRGEAAHRFPAAIPGQSAIVFTIFKGALDDARLAVLDVATRKVTEVTALPGQDARVLPDGWIIYSRSGTLMAARFDLKRRTLTSIPEPVLGGVSFNSGGAGHFAVSGSGTLVYFSEAEMTPSVTGAWARRDGRTESTSLPEDRYKEEMALSPDGTRAALIAASGSASAISVWDFTRNEWVARLTDTGIREFPVWMPDNRRLVFTYRDKVGGVGRIFQQPIDGGPPESMTDETVAVATGSSGQYPASVTGDGAKVFYRQSGLNANGIGVLDIATRRAMLLTGDGAFPQISRDGKFLAFARNTESGTEVHVRSFPDIERQRWTIPTGPSGGLPLWSADSRELFYWKGHQLFSIAVNPAAPDFSAAPRPVFESSRSVTAYGVHPDGQRFLVLQVSREAHPMPHVVFNWVGNLKKGR